MVRPPKTQDATLAAWDTNCRVTAFLVEHIPAAVWRAKISGIPTRAVRSVAAHIHNGRCWWIKTLGAEHGIATPKHVDHRTVTQRQLVAALKQSSRGMAAILQLGIAHGGEAPRTKAYVWRNLDLDVEHVLTYFVAHEAHHRGQIVMAACQLGRRLPQSVTAELWQWRVPRR